MSKQSETLPREALYSPNEYLAKLYDSTETWLKESRGATQVVKFEPQHVDSWDIHDRSRLSIDIHQGMIFKDGKYDYALILGERQRTRYDRKKTLGLQFGLLPQNKRSSEDIISDPLKYARMLANQGFITHGSGDFFLNEMTNRLDISCWADESRFGGKDIASWPAVKLLTDRGVNESVLVVNRLAQNAFIK